MGFQKFLICIHTIFILFQTPSTHSKDLPDIVRTPCKHPPVNLHMTSTSPLDTPHSDWVQKSIWVMGDLELQPHIFERTIFKQNSYKVNYSNTSIMSFLVVAYQLENKPIIIITYLILQKILSPSWLHIATWNWPDFPLSWTPKMDPECGKQNKRKNTKNKLGLRGVSSVQARIET